MLFAITPPTTRPGMAWEARDAIRPSPAELAQATMVARGSATASAPTQPNPQARGLRSGDYLTVPMDGEHAVTVTSGAGNRHQLMVAIRHLHADLQAVRDPALAYLDRADAGPCLRSGIRPASAQAHLSAIGLQLMDHRRRE